LWYKNAVVAREGRVRLGALPGESEVPDKTEKLLKKGSLDLRKEESRRSGRARRKNTGRVKTAKAGQYKNGGDP